MGKAGLGKSITVRTRKELTDAIKDKYDHITVEGDFAVSLRKELNKKLTGRKAGRIASWLGVALSLIAWPCILIGIVGLAVTEDDLEPYTISCAETTITLKRRK
ncbi:hypothetical protein NE562_00780 [Butyricicoccus faecihominis]|uniref:hypothetical protein n=1 Tax=Butyricicoccus faecihominis TaxID=1712515 RepID=UPI00247850BA|nr:hypothetical protein [Butyricicoccus faecihominis]MCQ5128175.1 hypothetical protein [Butyricicoccus faecihominis]